MTYEQLIDDLSKKKYSPIYFLYGEEPYYIDKVSDYISENVLTEAEKSFNYSLFYGKDSDARTIITACKRYPMMSSHQVIIVKEAQDLSDIEDLIYYVEKPLTSTILVVNFKYGKPDGRSKFFKSLSKAAVLFESPKIRDYQMGEWIKNYCKTQQLTIDPKAQELLNDFLGTDLSKVANEIEKLQLVMPKGSKTIDCDLIEKNIGISKDYNIFELQGALSKRDVVKAYRIIDHFEKNPNMYPLVVVLGGLYSFFVRLLTFQCLKDKSQNYAMTAMNLKYPVYKDLSMAARHFPLSKVTQIISYLRDCDVKSKGMGSASSQGDLLKELVFKILH